MRKELQHQRRNEDAADFERSLTLFRERSSDIEERMRCKARDAITARASAVQSEVWSEGEGSQNHAQEAAFAEDALVNNVVLGSEHQISTVSDRTWDLAACNAILTGLRD